MTTQRFSVLLPTRNGGSHLRPVIDSVLRQSFQRLELVVADNANTDATAEVLRSIRDPRLTVVRSDHALPVTENWMNALNAASGEYLVMLGDDDLMLSLSLDRLDAVIARYGEPDCVTFNGFTYAEPSAFSDSPIAYFAERHFAPRPHHVGELDMAARRRIVRDMFRFRVRFPLNMQLTAFSRRSVKRVPGAFFRAPFPDHFALNALLLTANRFVVVDDRLLVVGVSAKSFGHYFYSGRQEEGLRYLGSTASFPGRLEGSELVNSMYRWLVELKLALPRETEGMRISRWEYVIRQINYWLRQYEFGALSGRELIARARQLGPRELLAAGLPVAALRAGRRVVAAAKGRRRTLIQDAWPALRPCPERCSITEFAGWIESRGER